MRISHYSAWALLTLSLVVLALGIDAGDTSAIILGALFAFASAGTLSRYYMWPRRMRRP